MPKAGEPVLIARTQPHRAFAPAILATLLGAVIIIAWAVTASRNIRASVRAVPAHFAPVAQALAEAKTDVATQALPLRQVVETVSADLKVREDARTALAEAIKAELSEQP